VAALAAVLDEVRPQVLLTYDADGGYGHPDHVAAHEVAVAAAAGRVPRLLAVVKPAGVVAAALAAHPPVPGFRAAEPDDVGFRVADDAVAASVPVAPWSDRRRAALAAHATQVTLLPGGFALSNRIAQPDLPVESYRVLAGPPILRERPGGAGRSPVDALFAGLS
jgi:N-acetyl-1-D-myo-inositol-2-amino-2-deoxy-alpha-D-glucopyranoside deacetylase